jgi:hypothetical protein
MKYTLEQLQEKAKQPGKPADFLAVVLSVATKLEDGMYEITQAQNLKLYAERPDLFSVVRRPGLGDAVAAVATPIAKALGLPCVNKATGQLRPDSKCAKRKGALNQLIPPKMQPPPGPSAV